MKKRLLLITAFLLSACLLMTASIWAEDENHFWGYPGDTWTVTNPTDAAVPLGSIYEMAYVITDASGNVTARATAAVSSTSPSIPAGGKAILMNWDKDYNVELDSRLQLVKDETPALIQADLEFLDSCEFQNITDHTADVLLYSTRTSLSYMVFNADGSVKEASCITNSYGGRQDLTVQVPAGGKINVINSTVRFMSMLNSASSSSDAPASQPAACMARSANFTCDPNAKPALEFFRLYGNMSRSYKNVSGADCNVYGYNGSYVLYNAGGEVEKVAGAGVITVPAGYTIAMSQAGTWAVPSGQFEKADKPGLVEYSFNSDTSLKLTNKTGKEAMVYSSYGSRHTTIYNAAGIPCDMLTEGGADFAVPARHAALMSGTGAYPSKIKVIDGQFDVSVTDTPATWIVKGASLEETFTFSNYTDVAQKIYIGSYCNAKVAGTEYEWLEKSSGFVTVPAHTAVEVIPTNNSRVNAYAPYQAFRVQRNFALDTTKYYPCDTGTTYNVTNLKSRNSFSYNAGANSVGLTGTQSLYVKINRPGMLSYTAIPTNSNLQVSCPTLIGEDWLHIRLSEGDSCKLTNKNTADTYLNYSGTMDYKIFDANGEATSAKAFAAAGGNTYLMIPAGGYLHATCPSGFVMFDARSADFTLTPNTEPVTARFYVKRGEVYSYPWSSDTKYNGAVQSVNYKRDENNNTIVAFEPYELADFYAWADCGVEKVSGTILDTIILDKGECCRITSKEGLYSYPSITTNRPCLDILYRPNSSEDITVAVKSDGASFLSNEGETAVLRAVSDGTVIHYCPLFFDAAKLEEDPFLFTTVKAGTSRDFARDRSDGDLYRICLFGLNARTREWGAYRGFMTSDRGYSDFWYFSESGSPIGMVTAEGSDVLVVGIKDLVTEDPLTLRAYDAVLYDKNGNETYSPAENGVSSIVLNCEATAVTPAALDVLINAYDGDGRFVNSEFIPIKRSDLGEKLVIPYTCGTDVNRLELIVLDDRFRPANPTIILAE